MSNHIETRDVTATIVYVDPFPGKDDGDNVWIDCGRCGGTGYVHSMIDGGICYDCRGHKGGYTTVGSERKKAKGKVAYRRTVERKLIKKQTFHNEQMEAAEAAFPILAGWHEAMGENSFLMDLWTKAFDYELSEKQVAAAAKTMQAKVDRTAERQAEHDSLSAAPAGKERISGIVQMVQMRESNYGSVWKMIVLDHRNFKVWTTIPAGLWDQLRDQSPEGHNPAAEEFKGREVSFNATIEPSDDDNTFAFAKRPTKPLLTAVHEEQAPEEAAAPAAPEEAAEAPSVDLMFTLAGRTAPAADDCMGGFTKGDTVTTKDGAVWTVQGPAQNNTTIKLTGNGKTTYRFARNLTAA